MVTSAAAAATARHPLAGSVSASVTVPTMLSTGFRTPPHGDVTRPLRTRNRHLFRCGTPAALNGIPYTPDDARATAAVKGSVPWARDHSGDALNGIPYTPTAMSRARSAHGIGTC
jgi:hypothetical protein